MFYGNGNKYIGEWKNGLRHGKAKMVLLDGSVYEGTYLNGKRNGYGKIDFKAFDEKYKGYFKDGNFHGRGVYSWGTCELDCMFKNGETLGEGTFHYNDKNLHVSGQWKDNSPVDWSDFVLTIDNGDKIWYHHGLGHIRKIYKLEKADGTVIKITRPEFSYRDELHEHGML